MKDKDKIALIGCAGLLIGGITIANMDRTSGVYINTQKEHTKKLVDSFLQGNALLCEKSESNKSGRYIIKKVISSTDSKKFTIIRDDSNGGISEETIFRHGDTDFKSINCQNPVIDDIEKLPTNLHKDIAHILERLKKYGSVEVSLGSSYGITILKGDKYISLDKRGIQIVRGNNVIGNIEFSSIEGYRNITVQ